MVILCPHCKEIIEIDQQLTDGQHVRCPFCNVKFAWRDPEREDESVQPKQSSLRSLERPVGGEARVNAMAARVTARAEERARAEARQAARDRVRRSIGFLLGCFVVGALVAAWWAWPQWRRGFRPNSSEGHPTAEVHGGDSVKSDPARVEPVSGPNPESVVSSVRKTGRDAFRGVRMSLNTAPTVGDEALFATLIGRNTVSVQKGATERGGFLLVDEMAYFVPPKAAPDSWTAPLDESASFDPAASLFGPFGALAQELGLDLSSVRFETFFLFDEAKEPVSVGIVAPGETLSYAAFRVLAEPIAREARRQAIAAKRKALRYVPTVVFYDGDVVKVGPTGQTLVPRNRPADGGDRTRWIKLRDEALLQESKAQRADYENRKAHAALDAEFKAPLRDDEIRRVLAAGRVTVSAVSGN